MSLAETAAVAENVTDACFVAVPHPLGMIPEASIRQKAENAFAEIMKMVTDWQSSAEVAPSRVAYPAERFEFTGTITDINRHFLEKEWSLGLPIIPPTPERVNKMLRGTSRKPGEVIGTVPPKMGTLTVELVAVNAVMAGCEPEYLPVLMVALEAFLDPAGNWRGALTTTATTQFIIIVNGPVVKEIGIGYGQGAAGKGNHANGAIGYAINLISYGVGGSKPPAIDRSTLGSPSDYVCWVFGENEEVLPPGWQPFHVERGFKISDSVVTVMSCYLPIENIDHWSVTAEEHLRWWGHMVSPLHDIGGPCRTLVMKQNHIVVLCPEHAQLISSVGWTKNDFQKSLWERARAPVSAWPSQCAELEKLEEIFGPVTPESMIPITLKPEQILVVIGGGDGKHSHYFPPFPGSFPVSKAVTR
ncbi:hypothetical protein ACFLW4_00235 [Chloroflexota bacterium]